MAVAIPTNREVCPTGNLSLIELATLIVPLGLFLGLHAVLRLLFSPSLHGDGSDIILFNQELAWGYSEQPPLFSWLFRAWSLCFGAGVASLVWFRVLLLGVTISLLYASARMVLRQHGRAVLAAFSVLFFPTFLWKAFYMTHSLLLCLLCAATLFAVLRLIQRGSIWNYAELGILVGLGFLSKYTFAFFAAALFLSGLTLAAGRRRILAGQMLLSVFIAGMTIFPHGLWLLRHHEKITATVERKVGLQQATYILGTFPKGALQLVLAFLILAMPLGLTAFLLFRNSPSIAANNNAAARTCGVLLERFFLVLAGSMLMYVLVSGAGCFRERWLEPFALLLPLYIFCRLAGREIPPRCVLYFTGILVFASLALTTARCGQIWYGNHTGDYDPFHYCFDDPAAQLRRETSPGAILITYESGVAGNLRVRLPHMHCVSTTHTSFRSRQARRGDSFVVVWNTLYGDDQSNHLLSVSQKHLQMPLRREGEIHFLEAEPVLPGGKPLRLGYVLAHARACNHTSDSGGLRAGR